MKVLRIYNVSEYVFAGASPKKNSYGNRFSYYGGYRELSDGSWAASYLPAGGISFMLNAIIERVVEEPEDETLVFCLDSTPTIKRKIYFDTFNDEYGYKGNRKEKTPEEEIQLKAIKDILPLISKNVLCIEDYEADDIIASLVKQYRKHYDKIIIHTVDRDLYCLVRENVSIEPVGKRGNIVTFENYSNVVFNKRTNQSIPYNGILIDKLIYGDASDNIPGIGRHNKPILDKYIPLDNYKYLVNINLFRTWVNKAFNNDKRISGIVDLLVPLDIDETLLSISEEPIDILNLRYIGTLVGNKYCRKKLPDNVPISSTVKEVFDLYTEEYFIRS